MANTKHSAPNVILGAAAVGAIPEDSLARYDTPEEINAYLGAFAKRGYNQLDTSRMYGSSEARLGSVSAGDKFRIDTKVTSMEPGSHTKQKILAEIDTSLKDLKVDQINVEYLHVPDRATPFHEACEAMDEALKAGKIKSWGLSNYTAEEVQQIVDICEDRGLVKPSVYQGQYNPIVRSGEKALFPVLRKHGIAFYAFSPASGGFFAGNFKDKQDRGRWDTSTIPGQIYTKAYLQPAIITAAEQALEAATKHGISGHAMALRWTMHNSVLSGQFGDAIILAASNLGQHEANLDAVEQGPLPDDVVSALEKLNGEIGDAVAYHL